MLQTKEKKHYKVDFKEEITPKFQRDIKSQIDDFFKILQDQKKEMIDQKSKLIKLQQIKRGKEDMVRKSYYNKSLLSRPTFYNRQRNLTTFTNQKDIYLDATGVMGNIHRERSILPPRFYEHGGLNHEPPRQHNIYQGFGKPPLKYMSKSGMEKLNYWNDMGQTLREAQYGDLLRSQDGRYKKMRIDKQNRDSPKLFRPSDSKEKMFDIEKSFYSAVRGHEEPSIEQIQKVEQSVILNSKSSRRLLPDMPTDRSFSNVSNVTLSQTQNKTWRPNKNGTGYFNNNPFKQQIKPMYIVEDYIGNKQFG